MEHKLVRFTSRFITPEYVSWFNDIEVNKYLVMGRIPVVAEEVFIPDPHQTLLFAIMAGKDCLDYVGTASIHNIDWISHKADIGYVIGRKDYWGRGLGSAVVKSLVDYSFNRLGLNKLNADVVEANHASSKILVKNGFIQYARNPQDFYLNGKFLDNILFFKLRG